MVETVAGFINSADDGTVVVGVGDDGSLVGLAAATNVMTAVHTIDGRDLCREQVAPSGHPVTARVTTSQEPKEAFFIRLNNGTRAIDDDAEVQCYVAQWWGAR